MCLLTFILNFADGISKSPQNFENFKVQIQKFDGSIVQMPKDYSYVDVTIPDGNYNIVK